jgi:hypothetical protein
VTVSRSLIAPVVFHADVRIAQPEDIARWVSIHALFRGDDFSNGRLYQSREAALKAAAVRRQQRGL